MSLSVAPVRLTPSPVKPAKAPAAPAAATTAPAKPIKTNTSGHESLWHRITNSDLFKMIAELSFLG